MNSFESEAGAAFAFLLDQGFTANTEPSPDPTRRPTAVVVKFTSADSSVVTALSLGFAGEDAIHTTVLTTDGTVDLGPSVAHKGCEMRKALLAHAAQVGKLLVGR